MGKMGGTMKPGEASFVVRGFGGLGMSMCGGNLKVGSGSDSSSDSSSFSPFRLPFLEADLVSWERFSGVAAERALELGTLE